MNLRVLLRSVAVMAVMMQAPVLTPAQAQSPMDALVQPQITSLEPLKLSRDANSNLLIAECKLNGVPCKLLVDTAASHTTFDVNFVKKHFPNTSLHTIGLTNESNVQVAPKMFLINSFSMGGLTLRNYDAMAMDLTALKKNFATRIDGLLGINYLKFFPFRLSAKNNTIQFLDPALLTKLPNKKELFVSRKPSGVFNVTCRLGKENFTLALDSGATLTMADSAKGKWQIDDSKVFQTHTADINSHNKSAIALKAGIPATIKIGPEFELKNQSWFVEGATGRDLLGIDTMEQFDLIIDAKNNKVYALPHGE